MAAESFVVKVCPVCGRRFRSKWSFQIYCSPVCKQEAYRKRREKAAKQPRRQRGVGGYEVVCDGLAREEGGFAPGAQFSRWEVQAMLQMRALVIGTKLRKVRNGEVFEVVEEEGALRLQRVQERGG